MDTIFFIGLISAVLYWIGGWLLLICIFVSLLLYLVGAFEMRPLKTFFQDILELKSHSLKQPLIFAAIIYFPIFIVSASIQEISDYRHNKKSHCINSKFQRDLCDRQVDKYVTALLVPEKSERISKLDRLNFFIPKAGSQEGHFFYEVFLRKVQFRDNYNNPKDALNNPEIKKILDELEMHPSVRMLHASTDFANGDLTLEESIAVWERELSRIGKWTTKLGYDFSRLDYSNRRLDFYLFKKDHQSFGFELSS